MHPFCRSNKRRLRGTYLAAAVIAVCASACAPTADTSSRSASAEPAAQAAAKVSLEQATPQFTALLAKGDYAGAIDLTKRTDMPAAELDALLGTLTLDGLVDQRATTKPGYSIAEGLAFMETAALAGRPQSVADLRSKFTTGLNDAGKNQIMPPQPALAACWTKVEAGTEKPQVCVDLRKKLKLP
jgi:hypothetical protein